MAKLTLPTHTNAAAGERVGVIGAGSSGLAVCRSLKRAGIPFDCLERQPRLGGNWCYGNPSSSVYQSTHLISSKRLTEYTDFPMPEEYPEYPRHDLVLRYLDAYADANGVREHIRFGVGVASAQRDAPGQWRVHTETGEDLTYSRLVIANGHNWDPRVPEFEGEFNGQMVHSADYKTPDLLAGERVLVVGGGNSGCDIAAESGRHATQTYLSLRRGYHLLPKFFHGTPIDVCGERMLRWRLPLPARRLVASAIMFLLQGRPQWAGLPKPDHRLFESHPVINSQLLYSVQHGEVQVRPDIKRLHPTGVEFVDGTREELDLIVLATGFNITFPFLDRDLLNWRDGRPDLWLNVFHPHEDDVFVAGLIQPDSGQFGLVDHQAQCIAEYLLGLRENRKSAIRFREQKKRTRPPRSGMRYVESPRHAIEVEHFGYRRQLKKLHRRLCRRHY